MTSAAVVTGNTVVLKPSSDSPLTGWMFFNLMREVGLPAGVINFITGSGASVGDVLVAHPKHVSYRSPDLKKSVFISMNLQQRFNPDKNGSNASLQKWAEKILSLSMIKTDLDVAAQASLVSAFGFQGQKCSAASRAIVVEKCTISFSIY